MAYVEAVIVVGFFVVIYASVLYATGQRESRHRALVTARSCAWRMADGGCGDIPPVCQASNLKRKPPSADDQKHLSEAYRSEAAGDRGPGATDREKALDQGSEEMVNAKVDGLLFERVEASGKHTMRRPPLYGGGEVTIGASYSLPCNSKADGAPSASDLWNLVTQ